MVIDEGGAYLNAGVVCFVGMRADVGAEIFVRGPFCGI
jgi:hypothetical protein